jgi:hypothetical protein
VRNLLDDATPRLLSLSQMKLRFVSAIFLLAAASCVAQDATPKLSGYITRITSPQDFDINGQHIQLSGQTKFSIWQLPPSSPHAKATDVSVSPSELHPYFGEPANVYGDQDNKQHTIQATRLTLGIRTPNYVSGYGIVDAVLPPPPTMSSTADHVIRADGYLILISSATLSTFKKPLVSGSDIQVNRWVRFEGTQRADGVVVAEKAHFTKNVVAPVEFRHQIDCDPPADPRDKSQNGDAEPNCDVALPQISPSTNSVLQARVSAIGSRLIPKYQLALPATETTRINFRFRLIADNEGTAKWHGALPLPDGIILVPQAVVERLENDSQIAAVLADNIASALEKQPLRVRAMTEKGTGRLTTDAVVFGSLAGLAGGGVLAGDIMENHLLHTAEDQSGRVSLWLLQDAGYDINQAPIAWWLIASKKPQPIADIPLPRRAASLYDFLGESWPQQDASSAPAASSVASSKPPASASAALQ